MDASNIAIGIGLALGFAGVGVGIGQGLAAHGGLNGMSRQPEYGKTINNSMLLALVFLELVFLLTFVIGFLLMGKIPAASAATAMNDNKPAVSAPVALKQSSNLVAIK